MTENPNFRHLIPLNPQIKIFFQIPAVSLSLIYWPLTSEKNEWAVFEISKDRPWMDHGPLDKSYYDGPHLVNLVSKMSQMSSKKVSNKVF